jgi:hypothetical protein
MAEQVYSFFFHQRAGSIPVARSNFQITKRHSGARRARTPHGVDAA